MDQEADACVTREELPYYSLKGITNEGTNCFVNRFVQMIFHNPTLLQAIFTQYPIQPIPQLQIVLKKSLSKLVFSPEKKFR